MNVAELAGLIVLGDDCGEDNIVPGTMPGDRIDAFERCHNGTGNLAPVSCGRRLGCHNGK